VGKDAGPSELRDQLGRARVTAGGASYPVAGGMIETAENVRREMSISRADQDALALRSHQRAVAAQRDGTFAEEIVPGDRADPPVRDGGRHR
jgi:acetyl-CoA C-acetyltransferase